MARPFAGLLVLMLAWASSAAAQATLTITGVAPGQGWTTGGDTAVISGAGFAAGLDLANVTSGNVLRVGADQGTYCGFYASGGTITVPLYLYRGPDAQEAPSTIMGALQFDPSVIEPVLLPVLIVNPEKRSIAATAGTSTVYVNNSAAADTTLEWTAQVVTGSDWLSITAGAAGTNHGAITLSATANSTGAARTGRVRVTGAGTVVNNNAQIVITQVAAGQTPGADQDPLFDDLPNAVSTASERLGAWYGKGLTTDDTDDGEITFIISGQSTYEITTVDDQRGAATGEIENPFLLGTISFRVIGAAETWTYLRIVDLTMARGSSEDILDVAPQPGFFSVTDTPQEPPVTKPVVTFGALSALVSDGWSETSISVVTPPSSAGAVDVRVEDPSDLSRYAVWHAGVSGEGGFTYVEDTRPIFSAVTPSDAWLFGGVVAHIQGERFATGAQLTQVYIGGTLAESAPGFAQSAQDLYVIVPPVATTFAADEQAVAIRLVNPDTTESTASEAFTYVQRQTQQEAYGGSTGQVSTTAFLFDGVAGAEAVSIYLHGGAAPATLAIPPLYASGTTHPVYGLARASTVASLFGLGAISSGTPVAGAWCFDIHLYDSQPVTGSGTVTFPELAVSAIQGKDLTPAEPFLLTYPASTATLTVSDVLAGTVSTYLMDTSFANATTGLVRNAMAFSVEAGSKAYQSTVGPEEYIVSGGLVQAITARLYHLSAYALRKNAPPENATLASIAPTSGPVAGGTAVTLHGQGLNWATAVYFGGVLATDVNVVSDFEITAVTPPAPSTAKLVLRPVDVAVEVAGAGTLALADGFSYSCDTAPQASSLSPASGPIAGNTRVTLTGTNLGTVTGVTFGGVAGTDLIILSATRVSVRTPAATSGGAVEVAVLSPCGASVSPQSFTYLCDAPTLTSASPSQCLAAGGIQCLLTGTYLSTTSSVTFGGVAASSVTILSDTQVRATVPPYGATPPAGGIAVDIVVTTACDSATLEGGFTYLPPPAEVPEDVNQDDEVNALDVQLAINAALGLSIGGLSADANGDGLVNALDVQLIINAALGLG